MRRIATVIDNLSIIFGNLAVLAVIATLSVFVTTHVMADNLAADNLNNLASSLYDGGLVTHDDIQQELAQAAGNSPALDWNHLDLKKEFGTGTYTLKTILTHVTDLANNVEVLFTDTLPEVNRPESTMTEFTNPISIAEQTNLISSLVIPRMFSGDQGFVSNDKVPDSVVVYNFYLAPQTLQPLYGFSNPIGTYTLAPVATAAFNPLADLKSHGLDYTWSSSAPTTTAQASSSPAMQTSGTTQTNSSTETEVAITAQSPNPDTLTFDIASHQVGTLITSDVVLVYQKL